MGTGLPGLLVEGKVGRGRERQRDTAQTEAARAVSQQVPPSTAEEGLGLIAFPGQGECSPVGSQRRLVVRLPGGSALPAFRARGGTRAVSCGLAWSRLDRLAERGGWCPRRRSRR